MRFPTTALFVLLSCTQVSGQQHLPKAFETIRSSDSYHRAITATYERYEAALSTHCLLINLEMNKSEAKVYGTLETDAKGDIVNGRWKETTTGTACGLTRLYNAFVVVTNGKPQVYSLFPGHSYADPVLQRDAVRYAAMGAGATKDCPLDIIDTSLPDGEPSKPRQSWAEKWTTLACGKRSIVTIHFVPDATGTTINASPKETVSVP